MRMHGAGRLRCRTLRGSAALLCAALCAFSAMVMDAQANHTHAGVVDPPTRSAVNTPNDEFGAVLSADARTMYFTAEVGGQQRIMMCALRDGVPGVPQELALLPISRVRNMGMPAISSDGQYMVFAAMLTEMSGYGRTDLFSARRVNGVWKDVRNLGATVNSSGWDSQPTLSSDGSLLYFASDRDGGEGGTDIYCCVRTGATWSKAVRVHGVNSPADEMAPFLSPDLRTVYFASDRAGGMGGYDLYAGTRISDSVASVRVLGTPVNSSANEYGLCISACGDKVVVSSDRSGGAGMCDVLIMPRGVMQVPQMTVLTGEVTRTDTSDRRVSWVTVHSLDDARGDVDVRVDDETGRYMAVVAPGHAYALTSWETDAVMQTRLVQVAEAERGTVRFVGLSQMPCAEGSRIVLPSTYNESTGSMSMLTQIELRRMAEILIAHPEYRVIMDIRTSGRETGATDSALGMQATAIRSYLNLRGVPLSSVLSRSATRPAEGAEEYPVEATTSEGMRSEVILSLTKQ